VNLCSCACQSANNKKATLSLAVVSDLKFANIIHWPKLTVVGLASVPVKILKNQRVTVLEIAVVSTAALSFHAPF